MVFPHRACGIAAGAAPIPVYGWDLITGLKPHNAGRLGDQVATGHSPVANTTLARRKVGTRRSVASRTDPCRGPGGRVQGVGPAPAPIDRRPPHLSPPPRHADSRP